MSYVEPVTMVTTTEAGRLVGRSGDAIRAACVNGKLPGRKDSQGCWHVDPADVLAWAARTPPGHGPRLPRPRTDEVMELLRDWGSASAEELARVLAIHPGNVRKYLAILSAEGRAQRRSDGQWVLTTAEVSLAS